MKILSVMALFLVAAPGAGAVHSAEDAADLVFRELLEDNITGKSIMVFDRLIPAGTVMGAWQYEAVAPLDGYLVLIDDMAYANWEHPCRWVFVSPEGGMEVVRMTTPPDLLDRMQVTHTCLPQVEGRGQYEDFLEWFEPNVQSTPEKAENMYALIISGGYNQSNNHIRYYGDVQFIYNVLAHDYLLPDDHIVVCFADGTDPAPDQSGGLNSNPDFDDDGDTDITYDATYAGVIAGFGDIAAMVGPEDHLFIFTTDHGGSGKYGYTPPEVHLNLWNTEMLDDDEFQSLLEGMTFASCHVVMEQCYSGGFLEETLAGTMGSPSTFASAADGSEPSYAGATFPEYDEYVYYWTGAMHGSVPPTTSLPGGDLPGDPDLNGDGVVSFWEAADRARAWDSYAQSGMVHPLWDDDPDSCGELYYLGGMITVDVAEDVIPPMFPTGNLALAGNPLSASSRVTFTIGTSSEVEVTVYDMNGRIVEKLVDGGLQAGEHSMVWTAENLSAGIYIIRFRAGDVIETTRAVRF